MGFFSNFAGRSGGAIALQSVGSSDRSADIIDCVFEKNKAGDSGGSIMAGGFVNVSGCTFSQNVAGVLISMNVRSEKWSELQVTHSKLGLGVLVPHTNLHCSIEDGEKATIISQYGMSYARFKPEHGSVWD